MRRDAAGKPLTDYAARRDFAVTPEPEAGTPEAAAELVFVVHKHAARHLHYDLRLELAGVLKSWAVPRGPSLDPTVKRLAVQVEDHPLAYAAFEGVIPEGHYGAGGVIVWDRGVYRHPAAGSRAESEELLLTGLGQGELKFILRGEKLRGEFALVRTRRNPKEWLLLKKRDRYAGGADPLAAQRSVASGRTLEELLAAAPAAAPRQKLEQLQLREAAESAELAPAPVAPLPQGLRPMLATPAPAPFDDPEWLFEVKWDGYRALATVAEGAVTLSSRNLQPLAQKFPPVAAALQRCRFTALFDGEIVAVDPQGRPDFQLLQDFPRSGRGQLLYCLFDLLHFQGRDLTGLPLLARKALLQRILPHDPCLRFSAHVVGSGELFFRAAQREGLEGIVAKRAESRYRSGSRSRDWLKIKRRPTREGIVAGYTEARVGGRPFGTLVLGAYRAGELVCIGHAGGGFAGRELRELYARLQPLRRASCPFAVAPASAATVVWVRPELVCEVAFAGWTAEGLLRQPVFLRLREDKGPREVLREEGA